MPTQIGCIKKFIGDNNIKKNSIEKLGNIFGFGATSDTNLRMLVDVITIYETEDGLKISVKFNGDFPYHKDYYDENGNMVDKL